jgi:hypothetical protein
VIFHEALGFGDLTLNHRTGSEVNDFSARSSCLLSRAILEFTVIVFEERILCNDFRCVAALDVDEDVSRIHVCFPSLQQSFIIQMNQWSPLESLTRTPLLYIIDELFFGGASTLRAPNGMEPLVAVHIGKELNDFIR